MTKLLSHSFNLAQFFFFLKDPVTRRCINNKRERSNDFRLHAREVQPKRRGPAQANENHKLITPKIWKGLIKICQIQVLLLLLLLSVNFVHPTEI